MLPLLKKALDRDVPEVTQLLGRGDRAEAAARLHALKGFLPIFCFPALFNELVRVEKLCRVTADADLLDAYDALARQLRGLAQEVAHYELEAS